MAVLRRRSLAISRPTSAPETAAAARYGPDAVVCGVDEVGRGPLAGPVLAGAAILSPSAAELLAALGLDDSKRLTAARRAAIAQAIATLAEEGALDLGLGAAGVDEIERFGIRGATDRAMARAVARLRRPPTVALVDGRLAPPLACRVETLVGGDGLSLSIAAAAVAAKETRDRAMRRLAARRPAYGWADNKGYGVPAHCAAIRAHGPTPHHRARFLAKMLARADTDD